MSFCLGYSALKMDRVEPLRVLYGDPIPWRKPSDPLWLETALQEKCYLLNIYMLLLGPWELDSTNFKRMMNYTKSKNS